MEAGRERRDRVPDRSPRRSIVGQAIKGTLIVASDEQWRHRNYRYTPDTPFSPLDTRALSLSPLVFLSFALFARTTRLVHGAVLVVCTLVKHRWNRPTRGFYALPRSTLWYASGMSGRSRYVFPSNYPSPPPCENHGQNASSLQAIQEFGPRASSNV